MKVVYLLCLTILLKLVSSNSQDKKIRHLNQNMGGLLGPAETKEQQRANEEYQRNLKTYLEKFRNEQKAIADRFDETYNGLLEEVEKENKENYVKKIENIASTVAEETAKHQKLYRKFDRLRSKLRNEWMFPSL